MPVMNWLLLSSRSLSRQAVLDQDAMPVGGCRKGESLNSCNGFGDLSAFDGRCKKGQPAGVQIVCYRKCRLERLSKEMQKVSRQANNCRLVFYYFSNKIGNVKIHHLPVRLRILFSGLDDNVYGRVVCVLGDFLETSFPDTAVHRGKCRKFGERVFTEENRERAALGGYDT